MVLSMRGVILPFAAVLVLSACNAQQPQDQQPAQKEPAAQQAPAKAAPSPALAEYMKEHFTRVAAIRDAVVLDDAKAAQEAANWIVEHQTVEGLPGDWRPHVEEISRAAKDALNATSVEQAGAAVGAMGRACGACHEAVNAKLTAPSVGPSPTDLSNVPAHMKRHNWAIGQLWIGLVYPSEEAWRRGADGLAFAALKPDELTKNAALGKQISGLAIQVHTFGAEGAKAQGLAARGEVYGKLIGTCAGCHRKALKAGKTG
jgi:hypothetical protein